MSRSGDLEAEKAISVIKPGQNFRKIKSIACLCLSGTEFIF